MYFPIFLNCLLKNKESWYSKTGEWKKVKLQSPRYLVHPSVCLLSSEALTGGWTLLSFPLPRHPPSPPQARLCSLEGNFTAQILFGGILWVCFSFRLGLHLHSVGAHHIKSEERLWVLDKGTALKVEREKERKQTLLIWPPISKLHGH